MSIIVAVRKDGHPVIAADTMHFYGSRREHTDNLTNRPKIRKLGRSYVGGVGWSAYDNILTHYFQSRKRPPSLMNEMAIYDCFLKMWRTLRDRYQVVNDQPQSDDESPFANLDSEFIVVNRNGIFQVDSDLTVVQFEKYLAIGSGHKYAYGALHVLYGSRRTAEQIARAAVQAAIHHDTNCGGPIEAFRVT
jgi:ATP-dependent protease HslVU (ClpYQ) peptidase subunit